MNPETNNLIKLHRVNTYTNQLVSMFSIVSGWQIVLRQCLTLKPVNQAVIYQPEVNNRNMLAEQRHWRRSGVLIVNFDIFHIFF